jgi:hypothetical protein
MNPEGIDTSALLTMMGLIAAVWAVVPEASKLSFRLSLSKFDWLFIWAALILIHGIRLKRAPVFAFSSAYGIRISALESH